LNKKETCKEDLKIEERLPGMILRELRRFNGRSGPAYVAFRGRVHDVSESFLWRGGVHQVVHRAGEDLTEAIEMAPHGPELLERFPVVALIRYE